jgi:hypothetical protein
MSQEANQTDSREVTDNKDVSPILQAPITPDTENQSVEQEQHKKSGIHKNALYAARLWRNTMDRVDPHRKTGFIE